jgi:hypothetical protein
MRTNLARTVAVAFLAAALPAAALPSAAAEPGAPSPPSVAPVPAAAASPPATQEELRSLAEEVRRLKLEMGGAGVVEFGSYTGMGPGASKVYYTPKGVSIGGYGEIVYVNYLDDRADYTEVLRLVLYTGFRFNDWLIFNSEVEFEHGGREVAVEFAYLDFLLHDALRIRVGNMLVPVGVVNENHEPIFFYGVFRPFTERNLIPSTWNQNGVGLHGELGPVRYKAYFLQGLDVLGEEPLRASSWVRNARTGAAPTPMRTFAGALQVSGDVGPATFGGSFYGGQGSQGATTAGGAPIDAGVLIGELHALVAWRGLQARALFAMGSLGDARAVSEALGLGGASVIGSRTWGGYVEAGYDVLTLADSAMSLSPFVRFEALNLHQQVPAGGTRDPALDQRILTVGLDFKPIPQVVLKADYQRTTSGAPGVLDQVDVGVGLVY